MADETSEPILGLLLGSDSLLEISKTCVVGLVQGVLEAGWVVNLEVYVAVLGFFGEGDTGADRCLILTE